MGLVGKLKNILFEEEEVEIPVLEKKAPPMPEVTSYKEMPKKEEIKPTNNNVNSISAKTYDILFFILYILLY